MTTSSRTRLTAKQEAFIVNYVTTRNATQSAIMAGYSQKTAQEISSENLSKPLIQARRRELEDAIASKKLLEERARREILASIARETHFLPVTAGQRITAIAELNKMGGDYAPEKHLIAAKVIFEVVYRDRPKELSGL